MLICQIRTSEPELDPRVTRFSTVMKHYGWKSELIYWRRSPKLRRRSSAEHHEVLMTPSSLSNPPFWLMPFILAVFYLRSMAALVKLRPTLCLAHQLDALPLALFLRLLRPGIKVIFDNEDVYSLMVSRSTPHLLCSAIGSLEYRMALRADLCIFPNSAMRDLVCRGAEAEALIIPNIPEIAFSDMRGEMLGRRDDRDHRFVIVYFGLMTYDRGIEKLITAVSELAREGRNVFCELIGDGPMLEELQRLALRLGISDRTRFIGRVERGRIPELLQSCDASAILSSPSDPMNWIGNPNKLYESMALGLPVIASEFGEIGKIVRDSNSGLLINPNNLESVTDAIRKLAASREMRETFSKNARVWMSTMYSWENFGTTFVRAAERLSDRTTGVA